MFFKEQANPLCNTTLQQLLRRVVSVRSDAESLDSGLTLRTGSPTVLRTLVTSYVKIFIRKYVHHLRQDILDESESPLIADAQHVLRDSSVSRDRVRASCAAQFRIGGKRREHVSGEVNLWHYVNAEGSGIFNNGTELLLGVESTVRLIIRADVRASPAEPVAFSPCSDLGQPRPGVYLNPPSLIVCKMPVKHVELMQRHKIQNLLHFLYGEKMSATVQKQTSVGKPGPVTDLDIRVFSVYST